MSHGDVTEACSCWKLQWRERFQGPLSPESRLCHPGSQGQEGLLLGDTQAPTAEKEPAENPEKEQMVRWRKTREGDFLEEGSQAPPC